MLSVFLILCPSPFLLPTPPPQTILSNKIQIVAATRLEVKTGERDGCRRDSNGRRGSRKKITSDTEPAENALHHLPGALKKRKNITLNTEAVVQSFCLRRGPWATFEHIWFLQILTNGSPFKGELRENIEKGHKMNLDKVLCLEQSEKQAVLRGFERDQGKESLRLRILSVCVCVCVI